MVDQTLALSAKFKGTRHLTRVNAVVRHLKPHFQDSDESQLMLAVVVMAIKDLFYETERRRASIYLNGPIPHAQACGVNPEWVRRLLKYYDIDLDDTQ